MQTSTEDRFRTLFDKISATDYYLCILLIVIVLSFTAKLLSNCDIFDT